MGKLTGGSWTKPSRLVVIAIVIILIILPFLLDVSWVRTITEFSILALFAMAYSLCLGQTGMFSFGHGGLFGLGVYALTLLVMKAGLPLPVALIAAPIITGIGAIIIGWFCLRLTGLYFGILTLAFSQLIWAAIWKMRWLTGGDDGIPGLPVPSFFDTPGKEYEYLFIVTIAVVAILIIRMIVNSPFGFTLKTIRENEKRAATIGVNVKRYKLMAFTLSGLFTGLAGSLFSLFVRGAYVEFATIHWSFQPVFAGVVGGLYTFTGPIFGAGFMFLINNFIGRLTEYWPFFAGVILIVVVLFLPNGIIGTIESMIKQRRVKSTG
ncbi:branched-chain amino acid ABC transporter permease [Chloroflexota bacterium]